MNMQHSGQRDGRRSRCSLTSSRRRREAANTLAATVRESLPPGLAQPALRALATAGYTSLEQLANVREETLLSLHGMGLKAIGIIRAALKARGQSFAQ
jgi:hypothetical protein